MRRSGAPVATPSSSDTRIIGLVGTLSGPDAWRGEDAFEGADLAVSELNQEVPDGRPLFELVTHDDGGDGAAATGHVRELASLDRTVGIVYAGPPDALPAAEAALTRAGIPAILCYGDLYSARLLRPHIFQASPPYLWQSRAMARYLLDDRGYEKVGVLAERSFAGDTAVSSLGEAFREQGDRVVVRRYGDPGSVPRALGRLGRARVEAVIVQGDGGLLQGVLEIQAQSDRDYVSTPKARIASAPPRVRRQRVRRRWWRPQIVGFDEALAPLGGIEFPGTAASDTYARGAHHLPIPALESFRSAFRQWWDGDEPLGWELRSYDAVHMIGWASRNSRPGADLARGLEQLRRTRFGGLAITLGPDDHTSVEQATVGLWVVPRERFETRSETFSWLPLARGFSIDGERTAVANEDWRYLFRNPPPPDGPPPRVTRMRFSVNSPVSDPIH